MVNIIFKQQEKFLNFSISEILLVILFTIIILTTNINRLFIFSSYVFCSIVLIILVKKLNKESIDN